MVRLLFKISGLFFAAAVAVLILKFFLWTALLSLFLMLI